MNQECGGSDVDEKRGVDDGSLKDDSAIVELFKSNMEEKRAQMNALWESMRFFLTAFTALTTVSLGGAFTLLGNGSKASGYGVLGIGMIQWVNFIMMVHANTQLQNIYRNFLEIVATIGKTGQILGFFDDLRSADTQTNDPVVRVLREDNMLLSPRHYESLLYSKNTSEFIQRGLSSKGSWYSSMRFVYRILAVIALVMAVGFTVYGIANIA